MTSIKSKVRAILLLGILYCVPSAFADPLFESDEKLAIMLELPVNELLRHAEDKPTVKGKLRYLGPDNLDIVLDISVTTRGKSRLAQCRYPPLSINLKKKQAAGTVFDGQNKLKLVTPCRGSGSHKRYLSQEFAIYRAYNELTDYSFRVRMLEVTFRDSKGKRKDEVHEAFFIEPLKGAAARLDMGVVTSHRVAVSRLDAEQLGIMSLFHFMIGNTDWSARKGPGNENCCHNGKVIGPAGATGGWVVLPYDFDQSGVIYTDYSAPSDKLNIRTVRQRLYRGFCSSNSELEATIALFNEKRGAIMHLFGNAAEKRSANKSAVGYLDGFYEIINDPAKRKKKIIDACQETRN